MWIVALCSWMQAFQKTAAGGLLVFRIIRPQFNVKRKMVIKDWHEVLILWIAQVRQRERAVAVDRAREWLKRGSSVRDTKHYFLIVTFMVSLHYKIQRNTWASQHNAEDFVWMHASLCLLCASLPCLSVSVYLAPPSVKQKHRPEALYDRLRAEKRDDLVAMSWTGNVIGGGGGETPPLTGQYPEASKHSKIMKI